jgi:hypothetical protein
VDPRAERLAKNDIVRDFNITRCPDDLPDAGRALAFAHGPA